jgi:hypothetical protein
MKDRAARCGMDEADEVSPLIAMLNGGERALLVKAPHLAQDRFQPNAMLVDCPEFNRRLREGGGDLAQERA